MITTTGETVTYILAYTTGLPRMLLRELRVSPARNCNYVPTGTTYDASGRLELRTLGNSTQTSYDYFDWDEAGLCAAERQHPGAAGGDAERYSPLPGFPAGADLQL